MIILDASVLIAHLDTADIHHDRAEQLLLDLAVEQFGASPITLGEILVNPTRRGQRELTLAILRQFGVHSIPLCDDAASLLAELRVQTNLKMPDCCVLLAAEQESAGLATFDDKLAKAARDRRVTVWQ